MGSYQAQSRATLNSCNSACRLVADHRRRCAPGVNHNGRRSPPCESYRGFYQPYTSLRPDEYSRRSWAIRNRSRIWSRSEIVHCHKPSSNRCPSHHNRSTCPYTHARCVLHALPNRALVEVSASTPRWKRKGAWYRCGSSADWNSWRECFPNSKQWVPGCTRLRLQQSATTGCSDSISCYRLQ